MFVSSTLGELASERAAARAAIERLHLFAGDVRARGASAPAARAVSRVSRSEPRLRRDPRAVSGGGPPSAGRAHRHDGHEVYETERNDFAEAYQVACAESEVGRIASFDRSVDRVVTVERVEPPLSRP